jgi:hypothetical protein
VLAFRLPIRAPEPEIIVPASNAQLTDKLQWLALNRPHTMRRLDRHVESILAHHRPSPAAAIAHLSGQLEYRALLVNDSSVLMAPAENRLGRKVHDVLPSKIMEAFDRHLYEARRTGTAQSFGYRTDSRHGCKITVAIPSVDTVIVSVSKVIDGAIG